MVLRFALRSIYVLTKRAYVRYLKKYIGSSSKAKQSSKDGNSDKSSEGDDAAENLDDADLENGKKRLTRQDMQV